MKDAFSDTYLICYIFIYDMSKLFYYNEYFH